MSMRGDREKSTGDGEKRKIGSVETTFEIIERIRDRGGATLSELDSELSLSTSTIHDYLSTMVRNEYLVKEDNVYDLSFKFLDLGTYTREHFGNISVIESTVDELADTVGARAQFIVEEYGEGVYVYSSPGEQNIRTVVRTGGKLPLHSAAAGKAILAELPEERVEEIIDAGLEQVTPHTITDKEELLAQLEAVREQGYAVNLGENTRGLAGIGSPVIVNDELLGAVSVAPPVQWMKSEEERSVIADKLLRKVNELELELTDTYR